MNAARPHRPIGSTDKTPTRTTCCAIKKISNKGFRQLSSPSSWLRSATAHFAKRKVLPTNQRKENTRHTANSPHRPISYDKKDRS